MSVTSKKLFETKGMTRSVPIRLVGIVAGITMSAIVLLYFTGNFPITTAKETNIDLTTEINDAELAAQEMKQCDVSAKVLADPTVKQYTDRAFSVDYNFELAEADGIPDEVTVVTVAKKTAVGDWQTSQTWTYTGISEIKVLLQNGVITSTDVTPLPDITRTVTFTESEKAIIHAVLQDSEVQDLINDRNYVYPLTVYEGTYLGNPAADCPPTSCVVVRFGQDGGNEVLSVWLNTASEKVRQIVPTKGW